MKTIILTALLLFVFVTNAYTEEITVKYRSTPVDTTKTNLKEFQLKPSSAVKRLLYDKEEKYLLVKLTGTFFHYCGIPEGVVSSWVAADSLGKFYASKIRGSYDCRVEPMPDY